MKVDDVISRSTATTGRAIVAIASLVLYVKLFDIRVGKIQLFQTIEVTDAKIEWAAFLVLLYLAFAHLTNWSVDRGLDPLVGAKTAPRHGEPFGDHPDSYDNPTTLREHLANVLIARSGYGFGYYLALAKISLIYVLHFLIPLLLLVSAMYVLFFF